MVARAPPGRSPLVLPSAVLVCLAAALSTGAAIECYTCNSVTDAYCADPFTAENAKRVQCTPNAVQKSFTDTSKALSDVITKFGVDFPTGTMELAFVCQKFKQTDKKSGHEVVLRSCAFNPETVNACPPENSGTTCLQCNSDLCNGAHAIPGAKETNLLVMLVLPALLVWLVRP